MELNQLRTLLKVVETRSFTRAAEALFLTQPAISHQIRALERELGQELLQREGRSVRPTEAGRVLCDYARRITRLLEEAQATLSALRTGEKGTVTVAAIGTTTTYILPDLLHEFRLQHPGVEVILHTAGGEEVRDMVAHNDVDLGIVGSHTDTPELTTVPLFADSIIAVIGAGHAFAARGALSLRELAAEPLILLGGWKSWENYVLSLFVQAEVRPRVHLQLDSIEAVKRMVERGLGFAILPQVAAEIELRSGTLVPVALTDVPALRRDLVLIHRRDKHLTAAARQFMALLLARLRPSS